MIGRSHATPIQIGLFAGWDLFVFVFGVLLMTTNTLLFIYVLFNRRYPPIKAKHIPLITVLYLSMLIWFLGTIGTHFNLPNTFRIIHSCIVFGSWLRVIFGVFLFIYVHTMRLYIYYQIFDKLKPITYRVYLYGTITYIAIIAVYSIPTTILQHQLAVEYDYTYRVCRYGVVFTEMAFTLAWIGCISVLVLAFLARHINTSFNEYRKILLICLLCILTLVYQTVVHNVFRKYIIARWARLTTVLIEYLSSQASLFILLGTPAYNCLFHREKYREKWFAKMRADNLVSKYGFDVDTPYTGASDLQVSETTAV